MISFVFLGLPAKSLGFSGQTKKNKGNHVKQCDS